MVTNCAICIKTCRVHSIFCMCHAVHCPYNTFAIFCIYHCFIIFSFISQQENVRYLCFITSLQQQQRTKQTSSIHFFKRRRSATVWVAISGMDHISIESNIIKITKKIYVCYVTSEQENVLIDTFLTFQQPFNWIFN